MSHSLGFWQALLNEHTLNFRVWKFRGKHAALSRFYHCFVYSLLLCSHALLPAAGSWQELSKWNRAHYRQVLDLGLQEGDAVTGAALVAVESTQRLVVLTRNKLLSYVLV